MTVEEDDEEEVLEKGVLGVLREGEEALDLSEDVHLVVEEEAEEKVVVDYVVI